MLRRVSAPALEQMLQQELARIVGAAELDLSALLKPVRRVEVRCDGMRVVCTLKQIPHSARGLLDRLDDHPGLGELNLALSCRVRGGRTWISAAGGAEPLTRHDPVLVRGLRQAHRLAGGLGWRMADGGMTTLDAKAPESAYERKLCRLAFLAPDVQKAIVEGRQPPGLTLEALLRAEIPLDWAKQRQEFGFG